MQTTLEPYVPPSEMLFNKKTSISFCDNSNLCIKELLVCNEKMEVFDLTIACTWAT